MQAVINLTKAPRRRLAWWVGLLAVVVGAAAALYAARDDTAPQLQVSAAQPPAAEASTPVEVPTPAGVVPTVEEQMKSLATDFRFEGPLLVVDINGRDHSPVLDRQGWVAGFVETHALNASDPADFAGRCETSPEACEGIDFTDAYFNVRGAAGEYRALPVVDPAGREVGVFSADLGGFVGKDVVRDAARLDHFATCRAERSQGRAGVGCADFVGYQAAERMVDVAS